MILQDITESKKIVDSFHYNLLLGKKDSFLVNAFGKNIGGNNVFPIFNDYVFKHSVKNIIKPEELIDFEKREIAYDYIKKNQGKVVILERVDNIKNSKNVRLFFVWLSQSLIDEFLKNYDSPAKIVDISGIILFHPRAGLEKYPQYWEGAIDKNEDNYLKLGFRYLFWEKNTITQIFFSKIQNNFKGMLIIPVMNSNSYKSFTDPMELDKLTKKITELCFTNATKSLARHCFTQYPDVSKLVLAGYSRSGVILTGLFRNLIANNKSSAYEVFNNKLKEVYAFDIVVNDDFKKRRSVYNTFWNDLIAWKGLDKTKKIRLYSAETNTVADISKELKSNGLYFKVNFEMFKGNGFTNAYETYSKNNDISLVMLPSFNFKTYLTEHDKDDKLIEHKNKKGFDAEPGMEGHTWFVSRLMSHSLFHSGL